MNLQINCANKREQFTQQTLILYWTRIGRTNIELQILTYMLRNSNNGIYIIKHGYISNMVKLFNCKQGTISTSLTRLTKKGFIKFVSGSNNKKVGSYHFHKVFEQICNNPANINFEFNIK